MPPRKRNYGKISGLHEGDRVRTKVAIKNATKPTTLPAGTEIVLDRWQREQDGLEVWAAWHGTALWVVCHTQVSAALAV
jgi:hypothetical protein